MIEQPARVIAVNGNLARVRVGARAGCTACDEGRGCGAGLFGRLLGNGTLDLDVRDTVGAQPGQQVQLGIPERLFLRLTWSLYGWPLLAGMAGAIFGHFAAASIGAVAPGGAAQDLAALAAGIALGAWGLRRSRRRLPKEIAELSLQLLPASGAELDCGAPGHH